MIFPLELLHMFAAYTTTESASRLRQTNRAMSRLITQKDLAHNYARSLSRTHGTSAISYAVEHSAVPCSDWNWDVPPSKDEGLHFRDTTMSTDQKKKKNKRPIPIPSHILEILIPALLTLGADPNCDNDSALQGSIRCESAQLLSELLSTYTFSHASLTHSIQRAASQGRADLVAILCEYGGEVHQWALYAACSCGYDDVVGVLLRYLGNDVRPDDILPCITVARERGFWRIAERLEGELGRVGGEVFMALPRAVEVL